MNSMKVGILHYTSSPVVGGVESVIQSHAHLLVKHGYSVTILSGRGDRDSLPPGSDFIRIPEMDTLFPEIVQMDRSLDQGVSPPDFDRLVDRITNHLSNANISQFDQLIVHNVFTKHFNLALTAALFQLLDRGEIQHCIAWCHDISWTSPNSRKWVYEGYPWDLIKTPRTDIVYIAISEQRRKELTLLFNDSRVEIQVIYNGIDPVQVYGIQSGLYQIIEQYRLLDADPLILMPVRITQAKNIEWALELTKSLVYSNLRPHLVVTGPPDPHDPNSHAYFLSIDQLREKLGLQNHASFLFEYQKETSETAHRLPTSSLFELLRLSDLVLMPSKREGFGMPILEAGLVNVPVVTSSIPASIEVGQRDVFTIDFSNSIETTRDQILIWLESNTGYRLKRKVKHQFTWEAIFKNSIERLLHQQSLPEK